MPGQHLQGLAYTAAWLAGARPGAPKTHEQMVEGLEHVAELLREHFPEDEGARHVAAAFGAYASSGGDLHELLGVKLGRGESHKAGWNTRARADLQRRMLAVADDVEGTRTAKAEHVARLIREGNDPRVQAMLADHPDAPRSGRALRELFRVQRGL